MTHRAILWLQLQGKKEYLCQSPSQESPQCCVRTRWFCKDVQDGFPHSTHGRVRTALDGLSVTTGYHYQAPSCFSATCNSWNRVHLIQQQQWHTHTQSPLHALPTTPLPGVFTRKRASLILSVLLTCPVRWSRRFTPLLREVEKGPQTTSPHQHASGWSIFPLSTCNASQGCSNYNSGLRIPLFLHPKWCQYI